jgi:transposase
MARPRKVDADLVAKAQLVASQTRDIQALRMAQAVLLPGLGHLTLEQTAKALGVGRATVVRLHNRFRQEAGAVSQSRARWGGRRRALLSLEGEQAFLAAWRANAERGELVIVSPLRTALSRNLGRPVHASVVYRLLERHGWRKVAPDTRHPKSDPALQAEWKKKRFRKTWRPC